jgi:hypothetical protein
MSKMDYHGMKEDDASVLGLVAFENPTSQLIEAASRGMRCDSKNISECIMSGRLCPVGSGYDKTLVFGDRQREEEWAVKEEEETLVVNLDCTRYYDPVLDYEAPQITQSSQPAAPLPPTHPSSVFYDPTEDYQPNANDILDHIQGSVYRPASPLMQENEEPAAKKIKFYTPVYKRRDECVR